MKALNISRFVNSRSMVAIAGILMLVSARVAFSMDEITYFVTDRGILFRSANLWIDNTWLTMVVNTALILCTALCWMLTIQIFNPFRALTTLPASFFLFMMLSMPDLTDQLSTGTLLAAIMPACVTLLWSTFANQHRLRHIFLLFAILSALSMTQYAFAVFIPAFIVGCVQMKIFSLRSILAIALGLLTPWWIVMGSGLYNFDDLHMPELGGFSTGFDTEGIVNILLVSLTTGVLTVVAWFANVMKVISLNVNLRAYNGSIAIIGLFSLLAILIDFGNVTIYLPTLMLVASYQLSLTFGTTNDNRNAAAAIVVMALYVAYYVMRILF